MPNTIVAVCERLLTESTLTALVGQNIFGFALPPSKAGTIHPKAIVVKSRGGIGAPETSTVRQPRFAFYCYGTSLTEAQSIAEALIAACQPAKSTTGSDGTRLRGLSLSTEPLTDYEPQTQHPLSLVIGFATVR